MTASRLSSAGHPTVKIPPESATDDSAHTKSPARNITVAAFFRNSRLRAAVLFMTERIDGTR